MNDSRWQRDERTVIQFDPLEPWCRCFSSWIAWLPIKHSSSQGIVPVPGIVPLQLLPSDSSVGWGAMCLESHLKANPGSELLTPYPVLETQVVHPSGEAASFAAAAGVDGLIGHLPQVEK